MEEKKKSRPSVTEYREMEETVHRQCVELDAWRDRYRLLVRERKLLDEVIRFKDERISALERRGFWKRLFNLKG